MIESSSPRLRTLVEAEGPRLAGDDVRRRAVLVRVVELRSGGRRTVCYGVATATSRANHPVAMIDVRGFAACHRTLAWRAFADRVLDLTVEVEGRERPAEADGQGAVTRNGLGSPDRCAGRPGVRAEGRP